MRWADSLHSLISAGHKLSEIMLYTWDQYISFIKANARAKEEEHRTFLSLSIIADRGTEKSISNILTSK
jgi:hypothetical protein